MGKWTALLLSEREIFAAPPSLGTDKTDKRGVLSVLAVRSEGGAQIFSSASCEQEANGSDVAFTHPAAAAPRQCEVCSHLLRRGTCDEPIEAGLIPPQAGFGLAWPDAEHAATCPAFTPRPIAGASEQAGRFAPAGRARRHVGTWTESDIVAFVSRRDRLLRWGWQEIEAELVAERLVRRDRDGDGMRACVECRHYRPGWCGNHRTAELNSAEWPRELAGRLRRCPGFAT